MQHRRAWAIKCTQQKSDLSEGWHWKHYFPPTSDYDPRLIWDHCGGAGWIFSDQSRKFLREHLAPGNLAVCYQSDDPTHGRAIFGLAQFASGLKQESPRSGVFNCFDLCAPNDSFPFDPPLRIDYLYASGYHPACFGLLSEWTISPISISEVDGIVAAIRRRSRQEKKELRRWLARVWP